MPVPVALVLIPDKFTVRVRRAALIDVDASAPLQPVDTVINGIGPLACRLHIKPEAAHLRDALRLRRIRGQMMPAETRQNLPCCLRVAQPLLIDFVENV